MPANATCKRKPWNKAYPKTPKIMGKTFLDHLIRVAELEQESTAYIEQTTFWRALKNYLHEIDPRDSNAIVLQLADEGKRLIPNAITARPISSRIVSWALGDPSTFVLMFSVLAQEASSRNGEYPYRKLVRLEETPLELVHDFSQKKFEKWLGVAARRAEEVQREVLLGLNLRLSPGDIVHVSKRWAARKFLVPGCYSNMLPYGKFVVDSIGAGRIQHNNPYDRFLYYLRGKTKDGTYVNGISLRYIHDRLDNGDYSERSRR